MLSGYQPTFLVVPVKFKTGSPTLWKQGNSCHWWNITSSDDSCELLPGHMTFYTNKDFISWELQHKKMILGFISARAVPLTPVCLTATKRILPHRPCEISDTNIHPHGLEVWLCSFCVTRRSNNLRADGEMHLQRPSLQKKALGWDGMMSCWALTIFQSPLKVLGVLLEADSNSGTIRCLKLPGFRKVWANASHGKQLPVKGQAENTIQTLMH